MTERFDRVSSIVDRALDMEPAERDQFLESACDGDAALCRQAKALIEAGLDDDGFLAPLMGEPAANQGVAPGTRLGPFEIVRQVGAGGMGMVFEARQEVPRRRVAIKVIGDRLMTPAARQRFGYEVEALGALNHPGIAQIFQAGIHRPEGGGVTRELPWFAMEYVAGASTLIDYCEREALGQRARLELFAGVCDAVHHGHQKGVIHRDLKPENLLVDKSGTAKVIDFGVARTTDAEQRMSTIRRSASEIVGTLPYMSPEQARGDSTDVRSDVYGLGAVLYQLITGKLPIHVDGTDFLTSARRIVEELPRRPSAVCSGLERDLEAVLLKGLEKDPARRYASAAAMASDLRHVLANEPVEARVPSAFDQLRRFARRNRAFVIATASVAVIVIGAAIVSLSFAFESKRAEKLAGDRLQEADAQRQRVTAMLDKALARGLEITDEMAPKVHALPGGAPVAGELMDATVADLEALVPLAKDDPVVLLSLASAYLRFGDVYGNPLLTNLRDPKKGMAAYARALGLAEGALNGPLDRRAARLAAKALRRRTEMRQLHGSDAETRTEIERAVVLGQRALVGTTGDLRAEIEIELALAHHLLSVDAKGRKDLASAETHAREAVSHLRALRDAPHGASQEAGRHLAAKTYWLGVVLSGRDRLEEAHGSFAEAVRLVASLPVDSQQRLDHAVYLFGLGSAERRLERFEAADQHLVACKQLLVGLREQDPSDHRLLPHLIGCSIEWVYAGDRSVDNPKRAATAEGRRRATEAARDIRALSPNSKTVTGFAAHLELMAAPAADGER